jgi:hypothetical protein
MARAARKPNIRSRSIGGRYGSRSRSTPVAPAPSAPPAGPGTGRRRVAVTGPARSRSAVGGMSYTSSIVALNCLIEENPAANAMSPMGSAVVSTRMRAVRARCALASASGPAPTSALSSRVTCRGEYPSRSASPSTPARSTTPSAISRMARPATSERTFHSGEPGEASGLHRLQARNPACCAAAAVG